MRIEELARRLADTPRGVGIALVILTLLVSPGFVRVTGDVLPRALPSQGTFAGRDVAVLELGCADGVFTSSCLRLVTRVTQALEEHGDLVVDARSLASAQVVRVRNSQLRVEPLGARPPANEPELRALHARVRGDDALVQRFVAPDRPATFVYAELAGGRKATELRALVESIRAAFERPPKLRVTLVSVGSGEPAQAWLEWLAVASLALALLLAPGGLRAGLIAGVGAVAFAGFAHTLLGIFGGEIEARGRFVPGLLAASAFSTNLLLIARSRAERLRGSSPRTSAASALAAFGPSLAFGALVSLGGLAALLAFEPEVPLARGLAVASGLAVALVAYPLGIALLGLIAWPALLSHSVGEFASEVSRRVERAFVGTRSIAALAVVGVALVGGMLVALSPDPGARELRSVVLDSGEPGGALDPVFLERVAAFQRRVESRPEVLWSTSLVDTALAPANRALHDGDVLFATVPLTRTDVDRALRPWQREHRSLLARQIDRENRRVAVDLLIAPSLEVPAPAPARPIASALLTIGLVAVIGFALLGSARGGWICALHAAIVSAVLLGLSGALPDGLRGAGAAFAPISAAIGAGFGLLLLASIRERLEAGADLEIALSLALRETGPALSSAAFASTGCVLLVGAGSGTPTAFVILAGLGPLLAAACVLVVAKPLVRLARARFFSERVSHRPGVSEREA